MVVVVGVVVKLVVVVVVVVAEEQDSRTNPAFTRRFTASRGQLIAYGKLALPLTALPITRTQT